MAYTPTKKLKGVGNFHHFPKIFLKLYGRAEPYPSHAVALSRLRPEGCEWFRCQHIATSELSSTVKDNLPVLMQDVQLLDVEKIQNLPRNLEAPASHGLSRSPMHSSKKLWQGRFVLKKLLKTTICCCKQQRFPAWKFLLNSLGNPC